MGDKKAGVEPFADGSAREPSNQSASIEARVRQQAAVAELGRLVLAQPDLQQVMDEAVRLLAGTLSVDFAEVLELTPDRSALLIRAGVGWNDGVVGHVNVSAHRNSQAGYTLYANCRVIVEDLRTETRFKSATSLVDHGVISGMSDIIRGQDQPFGVLAVHDRSRRTFTADDLHFLRSIANTLGLAVERSRIASELHHRNQEFQALGENAPDIIARFDRDYRHLFINRAIERYIGISASELIGRSNRDLGMDEDLVLQWEAALHEVFETGEERWIEFSFDSVVGPRWFQSRLAPEFDQNGAVRSVLGVVRDMTHQRAADERLRDSEERFRSLSTSSPVGIIVSDVDGRLTYINPRCEEISGAPISDALGRRWLSLLHDDDRAKFLSECKRAFALGQDAETEVRIRSNGSGETWVLVRASPMYDDAGEISGFVATLQDITDRILVEHRLRFLAEAGAIITQSLDVDQTARAITEFAVPEFADCCIVQIYSATSRPLDVVIAHRDKNRGPHLMAEYLKHVSQFREPHPVARVLGTRLPELLPHVDEHDWERFASSPEHLKTIEMFQPRSLMVLPMIAREQLLGTIAFLYSHSDRRYSEVDMELASDLSDRAALAIDNARLYQEAQRAIRAREEFLSIASHELKTPLTSVKGYAQLLEMAATTGAMTPERIQNAASRVGEQVRRLEALISDLLDVSRIQHGKLGLRFTRFDLVDLTCTIVQRFQEGAEIGPDHTVRIDAPHPIVGTWDAERLDQVVTNLLSNALKYSPNGGQVTVCVSLQEGQACLVVSDDGIGIPGSEMNNLFQPFKRNHRDATNIAGTGLGLYIVRQIVDQHGGDIRVESEKGAGSRFTVLLPLDATSLLRS
jgi:PAS domain S-box-containing protein